MGNAAGKKKSSLKTSTDEVKGSGSARRSNQSSKENVTARGKRRSKRGTKPDLGDIWKVFDREPEMILEDEKIEAIAHELVEKGVPGACCGIVTLDKRSLGITIRVGCSGIRQVDQPKNFVQPGDKWLFGGCTKAITATLVSRFIVQIKSLSWKSTIDSVLHKHIKKIHRVYHKVTLLNLMTHTSGIAADPGPHLNSMAWSMSNLAPTIQREKFVFPILAKKPPIAIGQFVYSETNYIVLGLILEKISGMSYEELIRRYICEPLGIQTFGLGAPGHQSKDQTELMEHPWGHDKRKKPKKPSLLTADVPPTYEPAAKIHMAAADWGRFAATHLHPRLLHRLLGYEGEDIGEETPFTILHKPASRTKYGCGWTVTNQRNWPGTVVLTQSGKHELNHCVVWVVPDKKVAVLIACNMASYKSAALVEKVAPKLTKLAQNYAMRHTDYKVQRRHDFHNQTSKGKVPRTAQSFSHKNVEERRKAASIKQTQSFA
mmetsp:Transcript_22306/g.31195  ORF Transcript_22306/g.31195 Transcript_22306/m.31195 type:complete len:488 (-) Transcript_22306:317-1780(-)|eukprot:CAMPEP_0184477960 /NCGR_PEP_ID=MMETSP0113_2-20130426/94_1 /TAXON_ID=91329 /ORGANISM="Norrisiella sphaerica, Strain BC52" /LENGTH=487 /DNA_ID=CAMNT_0026855581 /DNA_START=157 /DNA_END=1620 /DNA_ORIENTATION=-